MYYYSNGGMRTKDRLEQGGLKFLSWILRHFPDFDWEADFVAHVSTVQNSEPSDTFMKSRREHVGAEAEENLFRVEGHDRLRDSPASIPSRLHPGKRNAAFYPEVVFWTPSV